MFKMILTKRQFLMSSFESTMSLQNLASGKVLYEPKGLSGEANYALKRPRNFSVMKRCDLFRLIRSYFFGAEN